MDLWNNSLSSLNEHIFDGLTSLRNLGLTENSLDTLDEDVFDGLTSLSRLGLTGNSLETLDKDIFDGLTSLQFLYLGNNSLDALDEDIFDGLDSLLYLLLNNNNLDTLDKDIFDGLDSLLYLLLNNNSLDALDKDIFDGLTSLQFLYLGNNSLDTLDEDIFDGLAALQRLYINNNSISSLSTDLFDPLDDSLQRLYLTDNSIASLPADVFDGLTGLLHLELSCNSLTTLDLTRFNPFATSLTYLDITGNSFTTAPTDAAVRAKLTAIEKLYISGTNTDCLLPNDTGLSAFNVSTGEVRPSFAATNTYYVVFVDHNVSSLTFTFATRDPNAVIELRSRNTDPEEVYDNDPDTDGIQVDLSQVRSALKWTVRARDGVTTANYLVQIRRAHPPATNARLRDLTLSGVTMEEFDSRTYTYTATAPPTTAETMVTALPFDPDATTVTTLNGVEDDDGTVDLVAGSNTITVEVTAEDGTTMQTYTVTITKDAPVNAPPAFTSADNFSADENQTAVGTVEATDDDAGDAVRYAITGGADSAQFQIDETTGVLRFTTAPDYEMPADVDSTDPADDAGNNVYLVTVTATSGAGDRELTVMQTITVTVNDVVAGLGAPTELNAAADGRTAIDLSWTAPVVEGAAITGYRIEVSTDDDPTWTDAVTNTNSTDTRYRYTDVLPGATYHFRVSAIDSGGPGTASDVASVSIDPGPRSFLFHIEEARLPTIDRTGRQFEMWFIFQNLGKPVFLSENILDAIQVEHGMASDVRCLVEAFVSCASSPNSGHNYYVFTVTADESQYSGSEGTLTVSLRTNVIEGGNQAAQREFSVDLRDLTVTLAGPPQQPVTGDFYVDIEFNLSVTTQSGNLEGDPLWHFRTDDVTVDRGEVRSISSSSGSDVDMNWSTEIRPPDSYEGDLTVQILANAVRAEEHTNGNEPSEVLTVRVDTLPPTVTITARETVVRKSTFKVTFTFSEPVTGFTEDDIGVAGGTLVAGSLTRPEADDPVWTVRVTAAETPDNDQVGISLPPDTVTDEPGNLNSALAALFVTVVYEPSLVPTTWSLIPSGLGDGDSFRLLFIGTTSRNASSSDIADYNTFVQDLAAAGHADIRAHSAPFRMLGSTENVDARDNTGTTGTGVPIYWLGGAKVADDYADFYDGDWDEEATGRRETGDSVSIGTSWKIWTGSAHDGTEAMDATTGTSRALGNSGNHWVMQGSPNGSVSAHGPIESDTAGRTTTRGVYGLSGVFTVDASLETPNAAPEFTSAASFSVEENQTAVDMVEATDEDAGDTVSYAITGGADQAKFDIDASSGVLTFKDAPDHENPTDAGGNNTYMVTVTATGGTGDRAMTEEQTITVTVTDVDETPAVLTVVVTSSPGTGTDTYGQGQTIEVTVTFDQAVRVTGTPRIQLRVGGSDPATQLKWANYDGGSGRAALRFTYRVQAADMDSDGIFIEADELELNSGTIQGVDDDVAANLDYPRQGTQSGHKVDGSLVGTKPSAPAPPWVQALDGSTSALDVRWIEPADSVVDSYDLRYRKDGSGDWEDGPQDVADTRSEITGLESGSPYEVQVRATNSRGNSGWSPSTTGYPATVYDIDGIYIYWTERQGSEKLHDDAADLGSSMLENACDTGESFRAIWLQPLESSDADEWEADVQTIEGTGTAQYTLRTAPELTGAVALDGFTIIGIRIRGRFGEDWSNWSRAVNLICVPTEDDSGSATGNSSTGSENATSNPLTGFEVVDATAHLDAGAVEDGATLTGIDPAKVYGFRVNVASGAELKSVKLELSGPGPDDRVARTENYKPYSLYGDSDGHEHGAALPTGSYTLTATAHSETNGGGSQLGTLSVDFTVVGAPLTVSFEGLPQTGHGGAGAPFTFRLAFSEAVTTTPEALRDHVLEVTNATIEAVSRVDERSDLWEVRLTPESDAMVTVFLSPAADCDAAGAVCTPDGRMLSHGVGRAIVAQPPNSAATGAPAITGTAQVGQTLTADTSAIADEDGLTNVVYSYQWMADGANIQGATGSSYTLTEVDKGKTIKVTVTFTDAEGNPETLTSDPTGEVAAKPNSPATGAPTITGTAQVGETLASDVTTIADEDGLTKVSYSYQWMVDDANIQGATGSSYTLTEVDEGKTIKVTVSFTDDDGNPETLPSDPTGEVAAQSEEQEDSSEDDPAPENTLATGAPTISGTALVGQTLTADTSGITDEDGLDNVTFSYQWMADDVAIAGATGSSYTLTGAEQGKAVKVKVSFTDDAGHQETRTSAATAAVAIAVPDKPKKLAAEASAQEINLTWSAPDGSVVTGYVLYRGILQNGSMNGQALSKHATIEATDADMTYTDDKVEEGVEYRYRVAAVNSGGEGKKSTWLDIAAEEPSP